MGIGAEIRPGEGLARVGLRLAALVIVAGVVGAVTCGCPAIREGVMRVTPGVPDPSGCVEGTAACIATDAGMVPVQCDNTRRMWPTLPRRADGTRRTCVAECVVRDEPDAGQTARCVGPDGGVR